MTPFTTPDLFDDHRDSVQVADSGLYHFGKKTRFTVKSLPLPAQKTTLLPPIYCMKMVKVKY